MVLVVVMAGVVGSSVALRAAVRHQDRALLDEHSTEVSADLTVVIAGLEANLRPLGTLVTRNDANNAAFAEQAQAFLGAVPGSSMYLVKQQNGSNTVEISAGGAIATGQTLSADASAAIARSEALPPTSPLHFATTGIMRTANSSQIGLAYHGPEFAQGTNIYLLLNVNSLGQLLSGQNPAFQRVNLTLYAGNQVNAQSLVLTNAGPNSKRFGPSVQEPLRLGADNWLLVVQSKSPLTTLATRELPWIILLIGSALAIVLMLLVESVQRRKDYALNLVEARTKELSESMRMRNDRIARDALLRRTARDVAAAPTLARAFSTVCETLADLMNFDRTNLSVVDDQVARIIAVGGPLANSLPLGTVWSKHDELVERAIDTGKSEIAHIDTQVATAGPNMRTRMAIPIFVAGKLQALVTIASTTPDAFTEADLQNVEQLVRETSGPLYLLLILDREREASNRLQQLDQLKSDFVGMVAHDLRSPMTVISGFADFLRVHLSSLSEDETRLYLQRISDNTKHLATFTEEVLQVARIESGELHISLTEFDLGALVTKTTEELAMAYPKRALELDVEAALPLAVGDPARQWQIIHNLVANALKYSETSESAIEVKVRSTKSALSVCVSDHGVGISADELPHIFDKFYRVEQNRSRTPLAGTGLGLYICKSLVEAQHGTIDVTSSQTLGTTFTYTVPTVPQNSEQKLGRNNAPSTRGVTS